MNDLAINRAIPALVPRHEQAKNLSKDLQICKSELWKWQVAERLLQVVQAVSVVSFFIFAFAHLPSGVLTQYHSSFIVGSIGVYIVGAGLKKQKVDGALEFYHATIDALTFKLTGKSAARPLSTVEKIYRSISLHFQAFCIKIAETIKSNPLEDIQGTTFVAPSYNRAKFADITAYIEPKVDYQMVSVAARDRITVGPQFSTTPFGSGVCFGSCMTFAHAYFKTHSIESTAGLFREGAPIEAVELQGKASNLYVVNARNTWVYASGMEYQQAIKLRDQAAKHVAGFTIVDSKSDLSHASALEAISSLQEGVHALSIPVIFSSFLRMPIGRHALLVIKEKETCTLFDPNHGTVIAKGNGKEAVRKLLSCYNTHLADDTYAGYKISIDTMVPFTTLTQHFNHDVMVGKQWDRSLVAGERYGDL